MSRIEAEISEAGDVTVECALDAPPEKVWRALTVPELVANWLDMRPDGRRPQDGAAPLYEIVEAEPFRRLRYRWRDSGADGTESFVTFELAPRTGGGTWFKLLHARPISAIRPANGNSPPLALAA